MDEYESLLGLLSNTFTCWDEKDFCMWKPSASGKFSTKSFYMALVGPSLTQALGAFMWCGLVLHRVEVFCWLAVPSKVSTIDVPRRKGITLENITDRCSLCGREDEISTIYFFIVTLQLLFGSIFSRFVKFLGIFLVLLLTLLRDGGWVLLVGVAR